MKVKHLAILALTPFLTQCYPASQTTTTEKKDDNYLTGYNTKLTNDGSFRKNGYWDGDSLSGRAMIRISTDEQLAYFYKGGQLAGISPVSTGMGGYDTPHGNFKITQKNAKHNSNLYGVIVDRKTDTLVNDDADSRVDKPGTGQVFKGAPMNNFMRFNGAIGMHTGFIPGYPASHGCVRLPDHMAKVFFRNASIGTPVTVGP